MIDIHTHILHRCDDGSNSIETSIAQIKNMIEQNVTDIVLTPHYLNIYVDTDKMIIQKRFTELSAAVSDLDINLHKGGEIFLNPGIENKIDQDHCIGNSSYILVETNMSEFSPDIIETLYKLVKKGFKPIIAHPERYNYIINDIRIAEDFLHRNVYLQINAGSVLGLYGSKITKTVWDLIDNGYVHFLASDNHCKIDKYLLPLAVNAIRDRIDDYTARLLTEINPGKIFDDQKVDFFYLKEEKPDKKSIFEKILRKL
ncbi:MAG: hypothetical protein K9N07_04355 [Candidatus Cloacimonetes bacterium]|nr:hypothetical protein [Candidatus Cloacimonadota bacterium]